ncbi:hypothetical protein I5P86_11675 [Pseudomonas glycinae]|uniref:hypothetical protein n=1 Tax=Pseudomonas glycinae TaxID=1785145 RepID=UPI0018D71506|nr:hypothetical protein [Pseudomonas glycinae]MBH3405711.1 hypothetical protein [Pseudomonas glycinae]
MMILLNPATGLAVNPAEISAMVIERNPMLRLVINMSGGFELQIRDCPSEGVDVKSLHQQLLEAV